MKRWQSLLFSTLLACAAFAERGIQPQRRGGLDTPMGNYYLLVIGIDEYLHWHKLKCAVRDAKAVRDVLIREYGFDASRVSEFYNAAATERNIKGAIRELGQQLTSEDSLLIYYAGHGQLDSFTKEGAWIPVEGDRENDSNWIRCGLIKNYLRHLPARHVLLISDSCFAGDFFRGSRGAPPEISNAYVREAFKKSSRQAITSGGLEPVVDAGFDGHSVFAHFLLKELRENQSPFLLPSDLHNRIKGGVAENASQTPVLGTLQGTGGEVGGEFVLFRTGAGGSMDALLERKSERLRELEAMEAEARKADAAARALEAEKQAELDALDAKIRALEAKVDIGDAGGGTLKELVALARQQEQQANALEELKRNKAAEEAVRQVEIARLKQAERTKRKAAFEADYADYEEILENKHVKLAIKQRAWEALCSKWRVDQGRHKAHGSEAGALRWNTELDRPEVVEFGALLVRSEKAGTIRLADGAWSLLKPEENMCWTDLPVGEHVVEADIDDSTWRRVVTVRAELTTEVFLGSEPQIGDEQVVELGDGVKLEMVWVPPGTFTMGSPPSESGRDRDETEHQVTLSSGFWLGKYEVTRRQWECVMGSNKGCNFPKAGSDGPVEAVSWDDCQEFVKELNGRISGYEFRLPTEAEWQYACRAGTTGPYAGSLDNMAWYRSNSDRTTHEVGTKQPNAWGLYDMHGNLWEWCADWYGAYPSGRVTDPAGPRRGSHRVFCGGSWIDDAKYCRSAQRRRDLPDYRRYHLGFRLVRDAQ